MLETVREYALERLAASGEADDLGRRHTDYFLAMAQTGGAALAGAEQGDWLRCLAAEQANLRAALAWLRDRGEHGTGLCLAAALGGYWRLRSAHAEGREWLETFLARAAADEASPAVRVLALQWAGELAGLQGDLGAAEARIAESLALARAAGDTRGIAAALGAIASALFQGGDPAGSLAPFAEALALAREMGDPRQTAFLLAYYAYAVGHQGDLTEAEALAAEAEALVRSFGDAPSFEAGLALTVRGWLAVWRGDLDAAQRWLDAAVTLGRALDAKAILAIAFAGLGEVALARDRVGTAAARYREGLDQGWEGGYPPGMASNLQGLVRAAGRGDFAGSAARLVGAVDALGGTVRVMAPAVVAAYEAEAARLREALGEEAFAAARAAGQTMPPEQAVAAARATAEAVEADASGVCAAP
jgi:ATP/maltotriose-dependent transcriptional regulator MalT